MWFPFVRDLSVRGSSERGLPERGPSERGLPVRGLPVRGFPLRALVPARSYSGLRLVAVPLPLVGTVPERWRRSLPPLPAPALEPG